jgi:hypothetical protein
VSKVNAVIEGWVTAGGVPVLLAVGDEYDDTHPLVQSRPDLFTEPKRAPGRPVGSKNKPTSDG